MPARNRFVAAMPWLLCAFAVLLSGVAVGLRLATAPGISAWEAVRTVVVGLGLVTPSVVGAVIAARLPANPYGWIWCALGIASAVLAVTDALGQGPAEDAAWVVVLYYLGYVGLVGPLVFVFLLFPTGRVPSAGWRWLSHGTVVLAALLVMGTPFAPAAVAQGAFGPPPGGAAGRVVAELIRIGGAGMLVLVAAGAVSLVTRYRHAGAVERQQLKWFVLAAAVNAGYVLIDSLTAVSFRLGGWVLTHVLLGVLVPVAVVVAVLRYRLFEIDRIVSRTVSYGLLSAALVGLYLLGVALLRSLLEPLTGSSALAVAGSTLAVAAAFNPARRRLQEAVDRRFDRARYDAGRAVDAFAARLRNQVDLDEVTAGLRDTVAATVAPDRVAVWLRPGRG